MKIKTLLSIGSVIFSFSISYAQESPNNEENQPLQNSLMEERLSELMADRVTIKKDLGLEELVALNEKAELLQRETLMFPADELYGSHWENKWVDPFRSGVKVDFPDSCAIDCSSFILPIDSDIKVTSKFGPRRRRMHNGIDLKVQTGDTIRAAFDGKVRIRSFDRRGYGYYLVVRHPNGLETVYGHLSKFAVEENEIVRAGQPIGLGGNTGRSTGSHLHFETRFLGKALNPAEIVDFTEGVPHQDMFVFRNVKINGRNSNIYTSSNTQMAYHRVKSGDTLGKIAHTYGTSVNELCRLNGLKSTSILRIGQSIRVGMEVKKTQTATTPAPATTTSPKASTVAATQSAVAQNTQKETTSAEEKDPVYHKIQEGDTLGAIAIKYGTSVTKLCELNGIKRTTILRLGRTIRCS